MPRNVVSRLNHEITPPTLPSLPPEIKMAQKFHAARIYFKSMGEVILT